MKTVSAGKKLVDKLVEKCTENIDEVKIAGMTLFEHENECVCSRKSALEWVLILFTSI